VGSVERDVGRADEAWAGDPPEGFVDLRAVIDDLCVDIRYATSGNFTGAVLPGYEVPGAWLRADAAAALVRAQASLREEGVGLLVYDAYRPRRATKAMVAWAKKSGREDLLERGFIAEDSAHARGRTIDVGLCDLESRAALDLGTEFDAFVPEARHGGVSGEPAERRAKLRAALVAVGFTPYAREWWHYSMTTERPGAAFDVPYE
jgi:D-alanyl-D-alanine dipeptidase